MSVVVSGTLRRICSMTVVAIALFMGVASAAYAATDPPFAFQLGTGTFGSGADQLGNPSGVAVDPNNVIYVADTYNHRIKKYTPTGSLLATWGTLGSGTGVQMNFPMGVAVDGTSTVYVADGANHRIKKFSSSGELLGTWGGPTSSAVEGLFNYPSDVAVDSAGNVYVTEIWNNRVQKFTRNGVFVQAFYGLNYATGLTVDADGNIYVAAKGNNRIVKLSPSGTELLALASYGSEPGQLKAPWDVAVDTAGNMYVTEEENNRVQKFDATGAFKGSWGTTTAAGGVEDFFQPGGIVVDSAGDLFIADTFNNRVKVYAFAPTVIGFTPKSGGVGTQVTITGTGFTSVSALRFNGVAANVYSVDSTTQITAKVPAGVTTGSITVTAIGGTATSTATFVAPATNAPVTYATVTSVVGPSSVKRKRTIRLSGRVSPGGPGTVKIMLERKVGRKWRSAGSKTVAVSGATYIYSFKPKYKGSWRAFATYSGSVDGLTTYQASTSGTKSFRVR